MSDLPRIRETTEQADREGFGEKVWGGVEESGAEAGRLPSGGLITHRQ